MDTHMLTENYKQIISPSKKPRTRRGFYHLSLVVIPQSLCAGYKIINRLFHTNLAKPNFAY